MFRPGVESPYPHGPVAPPAPPAYDGEPRPRRPRRRPARRTALAVALGVTLVLGAACSSSGASTAPTTLDHTAAAAGGGPGTTDASQLARARAATARYATDLDAAKADGYRIITPMMADMGYHFLNPAITGFDVEKPPILVYVHTGDAWQLGALEWLFPDKPSTPPLDGATYGTFSAACHYDDGTFVFADAQASCASSSPSTGSPFVFWHPPLVTMHVWLWYPNPDGLFSSTYPLVTPFNDPPDSGGPGRAAASDAWHVNHGA